MSVQIQVTIGGSTALAGHYFTWAPVDCQARVVDAEGATDPIVVTVGNSPGVKTQVMFDDASGARVVASLQLELQPDGGPTPFRIVPVFQSPSSADGDVGVSVRVAGAAAAGVELTAMVRIRKNANTLSVSERDRFLAAFAELNDAGAGAFKAFRDMHVEASDPEAHRRAGFLSWHRAYLLDLERELQMIDPSITLPYWRFDEPAPNVFSPDFMGRSTNGSQPALSLTNPLAAWVTDGQPGIWRRANFDDQTEAAPGVPDAFPLRTEAQTIQLGTDFGSFRTMEGSPHGAAHVSFEGSIGNIGTAAKDPLFFMLHCNVDRLWAKWQWLNRRYDANDATAYPPDGSPGTDRAGHRATDTMWPWNDERIPPRPPTAPRTPLASSPVAAAPGGQPTVSAMLDYQGQLDPGAWIGVGYDDVPFEP